MKACHTTFNSNKSVVDDATSFVAFVAGSTKLFHLSAIQTRPPTKNVSMQIGANKPGASQLHVDLFTKDWKEHIYFLIVWACVWPQPAWWKASIPIFISIWRLLQTSWWNTMNCLAKGAQENSFEDSEGFCLRTWAARTHQYNVAFLIYAFATICWVLRLVFLISDTHDIEIQGIWTMYSVTKHNYKNTSDKQNLVQLVNWDTFCPYITRD